MTVVDVTPASRRTAPTHRRHSQPASPTFDPTTIPLAWALATSTGRIPILP